MYNEQALREAYASGGSSGMWNSFMSTNKNAKRSSNGGWQSAQIGTAPNNMKEYKALLATLDTERRSNKPNSKPQLTPRPTPVPRPTTTPRLIEEKVKLIPGLEERISTPAPEGIDKITLLVGKDGGIKNTINDDNKIVRSDIGNDNSETELLLKVAPTVIPATDEEIAIRSEAKEKAQNYLDLFGSIGKRGKMSNSIGNRNIITDSRIGNDNSKTYASLDYGNGLTFT